MPGIIKKAGAFITSKISRNYLYLLLIMIFGAIIRLSFLENSLNYPDSMHYAYSAECLLVYGRYAITVNGAFIPPQYPPGLPLIISIFYLLLGISEETAVLTIAFFGIIGIPLTYLFTKELLKNKTAGLVSAILLSVSPLQWFYSTTIMSDVVAMFFGTASLYLLLKGDNTGKKRFFILSGLFMGYAVSIHLTCVLFIVIAFAFEIYRKGVKFLKTFDFRLLGVSTFAAMTPFLAYTIWLYNTSNIFVGYQAWMGTGSFLSSFSIHYVPTNFTFFLQVLYANFMPLMNLPSEHYLFLPTFASIFFLIGFIFLVYEKRWLEVTLLTTWIVAFLAFFLIFYVPDTRYLLPALPAFITLASYGLVRSYNILSTRIRTVQKLPILRASVVIMIIVIALPSLVIGYSQVEPRHSQPNPSEIMAVWVRNNLPPTAVIINGAAEYVIYYCQRYDIYGWTSININEAPYSALPLIFNYISEGRQVYAICDTVTQALWMSQWDELKSNTNLNFTLFSIIPETNIIVYRVTNCLNSSQG
jgi:4-amino-4-deoxy-L-arabinose transferase-like glycosyltransferase